MAKIVYYSETVTGVANTEILGKGVTSTEAEPKTVKEVYVIVSGRYGNYVRGYVERERLFSIEDYVFPLATDSFRFVLDVNFDLPIGQTFSVGIACGGTASIIHVVYKCEIAT